MSKLSRVARNRRRRKQRKNGNNNSGNPASAHSSEFHIDKVALEKLFKFYIIDHPYDSYPIATVAEEYLSTRRKIDNKQLSRDDELKIRKKIHSFLGEVDKKTDRYRPTPKNSGFQLNEKHAKFFYKNFCKKHPRIKIPTNRISHAATEYVKEMEVHPKDVGSHNIIFRFFKGIDALMQTSLI